MSAIRVIQGSVVCVCVITFSGVSGLVHGQSLAEVAKKEEERRKGVPAPSKVYTNQDLKQVPGDQPPAPPPAKPGDDAAKAGGDDSKAGVAKPGDEVEKSPTKDQAWWGGKLKALQEALSRDQNYADAMQTRINALTTDFVNRDDPAQRAVIERDRQKSITELARLNKSIQGAKKDISDLLEDARRAGVPPGWLR